MSKSIPPSAPSIHARARARRAANGFSEMRVKCPLADRSPRSACSQRGFKTIHHLNEHLKTTHVNPTSPEVAGISAATMEKVHEVTSRHRRAGISLKWRQIKAVVDQADTNSATGYETPYCSVGPYIPTHAQLRTTLYHVGRTRIDDMFAKSAVGEVSSMVDKLASSSLSRFSQLPEIERAIRIKQACELFPYLIDAVGMTGLALGETKECDPRGLLPGRQLEVSDQHHLELPSGSLRLGEQSFENLLPIDLSVDYGIDWDMGLLFSLS